MQIKRVKVISMNIKICIATQKKYRLPDDDIYIPIQVGAKVIDNNTGYVKDDTGISISEKNPYFCELTGLYWIWKNIDADYYGLVHYRRYFKKRYVLGRDKYKKILDRNYLENILKKSDIVLPKKRHYYIENIRSHYTHTHYGEHLSVVRDILKSNNPEYLHSFEKIMKKRSAHMFNMMIMKKKIFNEYCNWLFPILFDMENEIDITGYSKFQARLFGRISEILLDVWLDYKGYNYVELPVLMTAKVNWNRKIRSFMSAKFKGIKYDSSF